MKNINSLKKSYQFREVYSSGRSVANNLLILYILKDGSLDVRLGISVSKKVGNSVVRHRVIRLIRESFLATRAFLPEGIKMVVIARASAAKKTKKEIEEALIQLYKLQKVMQDA